MNLKTRFATLATCVSIIAGCGNEVSKRAKFGDDTGANHSVTANGSAIPGTQSNSRLPRPSTQSNSILPLPNATSRSQLEAICAHGKYGKSESATREQGDFNGDGFFDFKDVLIFMPSYSGDLAPIDGCPFLQSDSAT